MKTVTLMAAVAVVAMSMSAYAEEMPQDHTAGSPIKHGSYCWAETDNVGHGWWDRCDANFGFTRAKTQGDIVAVSEGGGGGGGGGGGR